MGKYKSFKSYFNSLCMGREFLYPGLVNGHSDPIIESRDITDL
jgi:hypothetical protein